MKMANEDLRPPPIEFYPGGARSLSGIALRAFFLGAALSLSLLSIPLIPYFLPDHSILWRIPFFSGALTLFHFLEFWTTARYNTPAADTYSYLLTANWPLYAIAHASAFFECFVINLFFPDRSWGPLSSGLASNICMVGLLITVVGQTVRSLAMIQCGRSFNHIVQRQHHGEHCLVTEKIYGVFRHPSYFGFFWWAVGTQLVMGNIVCLVGYVLVLWKFFSSRIRYEEFHLVKSYGTEYEDYRRRVKVWIPLIN